MKPIRPAEDVVIELMARAYDPDLWEWWDAINESSPPGTIENWKSTKVEIDKELEKFKRVYRACTQALIATSGEK